MDQQIALSKTNLRKLARCEERIAKGVHAAFYEVGSALAEIEESGLYSMYGTFAAYCKDRWEMSAAYAYRMIQAAKIIERLCQNRKGMSPIGDIPTSESQIRPLSQVDLEEVEGVWQEVQRQAPRDKYDHLLITGALVEQVVKDHKVGRIKVEEEEAEDEEEELEEDEETEEEEAEGDESEEEDEDQAEDTDEEEADAHLETLAADLLSRIRSTISKWLQKDPATDQLDIAAMLRDLADEYEED